MDLENIMVSKISQSSQVFLRERRKWSRGKGDVCINMFASDISVSLLKITHKEVLLVS